MTKKNKGGRPTVFTKTVLQKLEDGFKIGYTDEECCAYAGIAPATLYNYQNSHPGFIEQKISWKQNPKLKAKYTLYKNLDDPKVAQWYIERKCKEEFTLRVEQAVTSDIPQIVVANENVKSKIEMLMNDANNN